MPSFCLLVHVIDLFVPFAIICLLVHVIDLFVPFAIVCLLVHSLSVVTIKPLNHYVLMYSERTGCHRLSASSCNLFICTFCHRLSVSSCN